jgi:hypothetical protein
MDFAGFAFFDDFLLLSGLDPQKSAFVCYSNLQKVIEGLMTCLANYSFILSSAPGEPVSIELGACGN